MPLIHRDVGDVCGPDFVRLAHGAFSQQVGVFSVLLVRDARRGLGHESFDTHHLHQSATSFSTDPDADITKLSHDLARSEKWELGVDPVDLLHDGFVSLDLLRFAGREPVAVDGEQVGTACAPTAGNGASRSWLFVRIDPQLLALFTRKSFSITS